MGSDRTDPEGILPPDEEMTEIWRPDEITAVVLVDEPMLLPPVDEMDDVTDVDSLPMRTAEEAQATEPWRALQPASLFINILPQMWRTARGMWPLLLLLLVGGQGSEAALSNLSLLLIFFFLSVARTVTHFLTLRYRLSAGNLEIKSGLFHRRSRVLSPYRIQNIELVQNPLHKLSGLVELRIETAGDASTEGLLSALQVREAERLKENLERLARAGREEEAKTEGEAIVRISPMELLAYGLSQRRVGTVAILFAVGMEGLSLLDPLAARQVIGELSAGRVAALLMLAFASTWIVSGGQALLRHFGFQLTLQSGRLVTSEGLLTRRRVEIPRSKVQLVRIDEPWLRRQMGFGTALIETAALGMADGEVRQAEGVVPMVPQVSLGALVRQASPAIEIDPWSVPLQPAHPRALYRAIIGRLGRAVLLAGAAGLLLAPWGWLALALIPLSILVAWLDWKKQGWLITPRMIISRRGYFTRKTWIIDRQKIQSVYLGDTPLMRWHGLVGVVVRVAGSQVRLPDVGLPTGMEILEDLRGTWLASGAPPWEE